MPTATLEATTALLNPPTEPRTPISRDSSPYIQTEDRDEAAREAKTLKMVMERLAYAEALDLPFKQRNFLHWMAVNSILPADFPFYSKYFEPETADAAYAYIESIMSPIYQKDTICRVKSLDDQGDVEREMMQLVMDTILREHIQYKNSLYDQFQETTFFGNGVVRHFICNKEVKVSRQQPIFAGAEYRIPVGMKRVEEIKQESWPDRVVVSRFDFTPGPTGNTIQKMPYCGERLILPLEQIKHIGKQAGYRHTDEMQGFFVMDRREGYACGVWSERYFDIKERLAAVGYDVQDGSIGGSDALKYGELRIYSQAPNNGEGCNRIVILGDNKFVVYDSDWPRPDAPKGGNPHHHGLKPYSETKFARPRIGQVWQCKGVPEMLEDQQNNLNALTNSAADMIAEERNPMTLVEEDAGVFDLSELVRQPGKIVMVGKAKGIVDRIAPQVPQDIWLNIQRVRDNMNRYSDTPGLTSGSTTGQDKLTGGADTATGLGILTDQASQSRIFALLFMEQGIEDGLNIIASDAQQILTTPQRFQITGHSKSLKMAGYGKTAIVRPEQIQGKWHVTVLGPSRAMSSEKKAQTLIGAAQLISQVPEAKERMKQLENVLEVLELLGVDDPMRLFLSEEEFEKKKAAMQDQPHPQPPMLLELIKRFKDLPPDTQSDVLKAAGMLPSQVGGSSPMEKHLAGGLQTMMKGQQQDKKQLGDHLSKAALQASKPQPTKQPRYLPQRQS